MFAILHALGMFVCDLLKSRRRLQAENLFLHHQLNIALRRALPRPRLRLGDRALLVWMTGICRRLLDLAQVVKPETILRWHRAGFAAYWRWKSRKRAGRPKIDRGLRDLILRMSRENPLWGRTSDPWRAANARIRCGPVDGLSPWQNGCVERLIGTIRRGCLDHVLIIGTRHLRRILASYAAYYNQTRTHLALQKDAPLRRPVQRCGHVVAIPILSGLHHQYVRM